MLYNAGPMPRVVITVAEAPALDAVLEPGDAVEPVNCQCQISSNSSSTSTVVDAKTITTVPLTTRNFTQVMSMSAGSAANVNNAGSLGTGSQGATVNTASSERAGVITAAQLETLQLKGRDYMGMVRLLPGVVDTKNRDAPGFGSNSGFNIQGGRADSANITLDGVTNADAGNNTGNFYAPSMDAVGFS